VLSLVAHVVRPILHQYVHWNTFWHWCNIQTDVRNIGLTCATYYSSMLPIWLACWILVKYWFKRYYRDIVPTSKEISLTNLGNILGWYSDHINCLNWVNIWNALLSDIAILALYNRYILAIYAQCSTLVQYCTNMAVLLGVSLTSVNSNATKCWISNSYVTLGVPRMT